MQHGERQAKLLARAYIPVTETGMDKQVNIKVYIISLRISHRIKKLRKSKDGVLS